MAQSESRSRSELLREAARLYIERKKRMNSIITSMRRVASQSELSQKDVEDEIAAYRSEHS